MLALLLAAQLQTLHGTVDFGGAPRPDGRLEVVLYTAEGWHRAFPSLSTEHSRVPVAPDGTFEIECPTDAEWAVLRVDGTLATHHAVGIERGDFYFEPGGRNDPGDAPIELDAIVGGALDLRFEPVGPATDAERAALVGAETMLQAHQPGVVDGGNVDAVATLDTNLRARLEGLQPYVWEFDSTYRSAWDEGPDFVPEKGIEPFVVPPAFRIQARPGEAVETPVPLLRQRSFEGLVVDEEGLAVPAAHLRFAPDWPYAGALWSREVTADAEGRFRASGVAPWLASVRIHAPGHDAVSFDPAAWERRVEADEPIVLTLPRKGAPAGLPVRFVLPNGDPAVDLDVWGQAEGVRVWARTDADGIARLKGLPAGRTRLSAAAQVHWTGKLGRVRRNGVVRVVPARGGGALPVWFIDASLTLDGVDPEEPSTLELQPADDVRIDVTLGPEFGPDEAGVIVVRGEVSTSEYRRIQKNGSGPGSLLPTPNAAGDRTAHFVGPLPPGSYTAVAFVRGEELHAAPRVLARGVPFTVPVFGKPPEISLVVEPVAEVVARVVFPDGRPVPDARIRGLAEPTHTDADGRFRFRPFLARDFSLRVEAEGVITESVTLESPAPGSEPVIVVRPGAVLDPVWGGAGRGDRIVLATDRRDGAWSVAGVLQSGTSKGQWSTFEAGTYRAALLRPSGNGVEVLDFRSLELEAGAEHAFDGRVPEDEADRVRVSGRLDVGWLGAAWLAVRVSIDGQPRAITWTDGAGAFACDVPRAPRFTVEVFEVVDGLARLDVPYPGALDVLAFGTDRGRPLAGLEVEVGPGDTLRVPEIRLPGGAVWGTVEAARPEGDGGEWVAVAIDAEDAVARVARIAFGRFRLGWLAPGVYDVEVPGVGWERVEVGSGGPTYVTFR